MMRLVCCRKGVAQECPDYVTAGPNSCFFDEKRTQVWQIYCMNITAHTRSGPITSPLYCLDVVDIGDVLHSLAYIRFVVCVCLVYSVRADMCWVRVITLFSLFLSLSLSVCAVETDPPFNLSYSVLNTSADESGRTILVSWLYPSAAEVNSGWLTLEYEMRYRHLSEPDQWKVKKPGLFPQESEM